jgi:hypothetical protein
MERSAAGKIEVSAIRFAPPLRVNFGDGLSLNHMAKKPSQAKPYQVFISHATADKWIATTLTNLFEEVGAKVFRDDRDINGGDDIPDSIRMEIKRSQEVVVLLTPHSVNRQWVLLEVGAAWGWRRHVRITPIMCHVELDPLPDMLKSKKAISINDSATFCSELKERVKKYHGKN